MESSYFILWLLYVAVVRHAFHSKFLFTCSDGCNSSILTNYLSVCDSSVLGIATSSEFEEPFLSACAAAWLRLCLHTVTARSSGGWLGLVRANFRICRFVDLFFFGHSPHFVPVPFFHWRLKETRIERIDFSY